MPIKNSESRPQSPLWLQGWQMMGRPGSLVEGVSRNGGACNIQQFPNKRWRREAQTVLSQNKIPNPPLHGDRWANTTLIFCMQFLRKMGVITILPSWRCCGNEMRWLMTMAKCPSQYKLFINMTYCHHVRTQDTGTWKRNKLPTGAHLLGGRAGGDAEMLRGFQKRAYKWAKRQS